MRLNVVRFFTDELLLQPVTIAGAAVPLRTEDCSFVKNWPSDIFWVPARSHSSYVDRGERAGCTLPEEQMSALFEALRKKQDVKAPPGC